MKLERLHGKDDRYFAEAWMLYQEAFPANERRDGAWQEKALAAEEYRMCAAIENEAVCAIVFYWCQGDELFLEHFAVSPALRGQGLGAVLLRQLREFPGRLILEIEKPVDERTRRRLRFYEREGLSLSPFGYDSPSYQAGQARCPLQLMSEGVLNEEMFARHCALMRERVLACTDGHGETLEVWKER